MSYRVVLYAEGGGEAPAPPPVPRGPDLDEAELGPAHVLVRRCIASAGHIPERAVRFYHPLRVAGGRVARGSDFLDPQRVRQLLSWPPGQGPNLAVLIVDADGRGPQRIADLRQWTNGLLQRHVTGVAVQEFEAWLIADDASVAKALGTPFPTPPAPESMQPRDAKSLLASAVGARDEQQLRLTIAAMCDLDLVARKCNSFEGFRKEIHSAVP